MANFELAGHYGYRRIIKTMAPMVAMMVVTSIYSIVDGFFVSNFTGSTAFASMNLIWPFCNIAAVFGIMIGTGGSALVSKTLGEGDRDKACSIFTMLIRLCVAAGIVLAVLMFIFMDKVAVLLGARGEMVALASLYGRIIILALPLNIIQLAFNSFYMTAEMPHLGTLMSIVCGVTNLVLDFVFIVLFHWGLAGAAAGTAVSMAVGGIFPVLWFRSRRNHTHLRFRRTKNDWRAILKSCTNGMSEYVGNISLSILSICYNFQLMRLIGENGVSAYGILMYVGFFFGAVFIGYNLGISQVISFNYGAGNRAELRSLLRKSLVIISITGIVMWMSAELSSPLLARTFVGYDRELAEITRHAICIYMFSYLLCGLNIFTSAWFTALNNGLISALSAFAKLMVFELGAVIILPHFFGIEGVWMSVNVAEVISFILNAGLIMGFRRRYLADPAV